MSHGQVDDALRILNRISNKPSLLKVAEQKGINAVRPVATIATEATAEYWAKNALKMSRHELEAFVRAHNNQENQTSQQVAADNDQQPTDKTVTMKLKPELAEKLERLNKGDWNDLVEKFIKLYEKDLSESKPPIHEETSRNIPKNIKNYVLKRSGGTCEFPKCKQKYRHLHHTNRFASNKIHNPDQIMALCEAHHKLAHRSLIDNEESLSKTQAFLFFSISNSGTTKACSADDSFLM